MNITELKSNLIPKLEEWVKHLNYSMRKQGKEFNSSFGFGNYVLINRLKIISLWKLLVFKKSATIRNL